MTLLARYETSISSLITFLSSFCEKAQTNPLSKQSRFYFTASTSTFTIAGYRRDLMDCGDRDHPFSGE